MIPRDTLPGPMRHLLLAAFAVAASLAAVLPLHADGHPFGLRVATVSATPGQRVDVAIDLEPAGAAISAIAFYVEYDPSRLTFEPPAPNALTTSDPVFRSSYGSIDTGDKRLVGVCVYDPDVPLASLPAGRLAILSFRVADSAEGFAPLTIARGIDAAAPDSRTVDPAAARIEPGGVAIAAPAPNGFAQGRSRTARPPATSQPAEGESILVPVVVRGTANHARSTLALFNDSETEARIRVAPLGDRSLTRDLTLRPHETRNFDDFAAEIFGAQEFSNGAIIESSTSRLVARSSIVMKDSGSHQTTTQSIPTVPWRALNGRENRATFAGLRLSGTTLTLLNPERRAIALRIRILRNDGTELVRQDVALSAGENGTSVHLADDLAGLDDAVVSVDVEAVNDAVFYAYAAVIDGDGPPQFVAPR